MYNSDDPLGDRLAGRRAPERVVPIRPLPPLPPRRPDPDPEPAAASGPTGTQPRQRGFRAAFGDTSRKIGDWRRNEKARGRRLRDRPWLLGLALLIALFFGGFLFGGTLAFSPGGTESIPAWFSWLVTILAVISFGGAIARHRGNRRVGGDSDEVRSPAPYWWLGGALLGLGLLSFFPFASLLAVVLYAMVIFFLLALYLSRQEERWLLVSVVTLAMVAATMSGYWVLPHQNGYASAPELSQQQKDLMAKSCADLLKIVGNAADKNRGCGNDAIDRVEKEYTAYSSSDPNRPGEKEKCEAHEHKSDSTEAALLKICQADIWGVRGGPKGTKAAHQENVRILCVFAAALDSPCQQSRLAFADSSPYDK